MKLKLTLLLLLSLAAARAQSDFHIYPGTENLTEGGRVEKLTVVSGNLQFNIRPPKDWFRQMDAASRKIIFKSPTGQSAMIIQLTTNSPDSLPDQDVLQTQALQAHPGAGVVQSSTFPTSYQPGMFFDLTHIPAPQLVLKIRHAFVAEPDGEVEFILSGSDEEFNKYKNLFMSMLRDFRVDPLTPKQP